MQVAIVTMGEMRGKSGHHHAGWGVICRHEKCGQAVEVLQNLLLNRQDG